MTYTSLLNVEVARWLVYKSVGGKAYFPLYFPIYFGGSDNAFGEPQITLIFDKSGIACTLFNLDTTKRKELPGEYKNVEYIAYFKSSQTLNIDDRIKYNGDTYFINELFTGSESYIQKAYLERLS